MDNTSTIILASSLFIIMLGMGLSLVISDFKRIFVYSKAILIGLTRIAKFYLQDTKYLP